MQGSTQLSGGKAGSSGLILSLHTYIHAHRHTYCISWCYGSRQALGEDGVRKNVDQEAPQYVERGAVQ